MTQQEIKEIAKKYDEFTFTENIREQMAKKMPDELYNKVIKNINVVSHLPRNEVK